MKTLNPSYGIALITDGSAHYRDRSGGWAWVCVDAYEGMAKGSGFRMDTTIGQMELMAPAKGLEAIYDCLGPCEVIVFSDSEYVVRGATDPTRKRNKNKVYWKVLDSEIAKHKYVEFTHVKGHSGHMYNEMCDQLANDTRKAGLKGRNSQL